MNIIEALKTGKKIRRRDWLEYLDHNRLMNRGFVPFEVLADDWEVEPEQLKPCPFCGNEGVVCHGLSSYWVSCIKCGATSFTTKSQEEALAEWNRRV